MFKLSLKHILSRKGRLILTALAVIAGTAFLNGVFVFSDTIKGSFDRLFASAYEHTDAFVRSANVIEGDFGNDTRDRIDLSLLGVVESVPHVESAFADVQGTAAVVFEGKTVGQDGPPKYGSVWSGSANSPWSLKEGRGPEGPNEAVIDGASAKKSGIEIGDTVTVTTLEAQRDFTIVGIAKFAGSDSTGGATFVLFDLPTAQEMVIGDTTKVDSIIVVGDGTVSQQELADSVQAAIDDPAVETLTGAEIIKENQDAVETSLSFLTIFLTIFAVISLFVGSFIIYNVFSISAAQREKENALLRAVGASRSQVTRSMFIEALIVGLGGSVLGSLGGVGLAFVILTGLNAAGFGPGDTQLTIHVTGFVITLIVGTVVTMLCAVVPAIRSGRVPPLAAMRDVAIDRADVSMKRKVVGGASVLIAIASVAAGLGGDARWLGVGVAALFTALIALGPFVAGPIARLSSPALGKLRGAAGTMAGRNAARNPKRTALTAGALAVGLSLIIGVATLGSSAKASIREVIGESFVGDYIVTPSDQQSGFVPPQLVQDLNDADVGEVFPVGFSQVVLGDDTKGTFVAAIDPKPAEDLFNFDFTDGGFPQLTADGVLLQKDKASSLDVGMGDTLPVRLIDGSLVTLTVQGIYTTGGYTDILVNRALFTGPSANFLRDIQVYVKSAGGESAATTATLEGIVDQYPTVKVQSRDGFIDSTDDQIDGFLNFIYALLAMSVFIAAIGIVITLWLAVWERRRELGLLRAVGMTRRQVRSSVLWESIITGVVGVVMGTVLGTTLGWIIVKSFEDDGLGVFKAPVGTISVAAIGVFLLAAAAAFIPARKAAKADMLDAIATT